ncbi:MAG: ATP-binding protein, partial [Verrucomicrobia bacterium]|nr:ATP-binding protein [Verrucomicrobiota bacterium]
RGTRIEVEGRMPEDELLLNPKRLHRVFANLFTNASEAMGRKGVIKLRFQADSKGVTTTVEDSGPGIAPEVVHHLFDPFVTHGKPNGTGLGLAIARKIIEDHKGTIAAGAGAKGGAAFTFWLPKPGES